MGKQGLGELLLFEGEGELFPFSKEGGALGAELLEFGGVLLGLVGGGEAAEAAFGGGDCVLETGDSASAWRRRSSSCLSLMGFRRLMGIAG